MGKLKFRESHHFYDLLTYFYDNDENMCAQIHKYTNSQNNEMLNTRTFIIINSNFGQNLKAKIKSYNVYSHFFMWFQNLKD